MADVQDCDPGAEAFDAAYSRFGVMFFNDPVAAFANVRRMLTAGGVLAFCSWRPITENEAMLVPARAAAEATGGALPVPEPGGPGPFALADGNHVRAVLRAAGFDDVKIDVFDEPVVIAEPDIAGFVDQAMNGGAVRTMLASADDHARDQARAATEGALAARARDGNVLLARAANIVTAHR